MKNYKNHKKITKGFSLLVSISITTLLIVIALAMSSLSNTRVTSAQSSSAHDQARANARVALASALSQLQKYAGPDTRITARADILNDTNPKITGVWASWEGLNHDTTTGKPIAPNYSIKNTDVTLLDNPSTNNYLVPDTGRFLKWLTSPGELPASGVSSITGVSNSNTTGYVKLVGDGSTTDTSDEIYIQPTVLDDSGAIAWWTSGENVKATLQTDTESDPTPATGTATDGEIVRWQQRTISNGKMRAASFGSEFSNVDDLYDSNPPLISKETIEATFTTSDSFKNIHEIGTHGIGLLTNTATGGWRKDLSLFSENYSSLPDYTSTPTNNFPTYNITPYSAPFNGNKPPALYDIASNPLLYHWADYKFPNIAITSSNGNKNWRKVPAVNSWSSLVDYMMQYTELTSTSSTSTDMPTQGSRYQDYVNYQEKSWRAPQIARLQIILSMISIKDPADSTKYIPGILLSPALTLWNPYNIEIDVDSFTIPLFAPAPTSFTFETKTGSSIIETSKETTLSYVITTAGSNGSLNLNVNTPFVIPPGGTITFGYNSLDTTDLNNKNLSLTEGFQEYNGQIYTNLMFNDLNTTSSEMSSINSSDTFSVKDVGMKAAHKHVTGSYDTSDTTIIEAETFGNYFDIVYNSKKIEQKYRAAFDLTSTDFDESVRDSVYPFTLNATIDHRIDQLDVSSSPANSKPFLLATLSNKYISPLPFEYTHTDPDTNSHNYLQTKGSLQSKPISHYTALGGSNTADQDNGSLHPVNGNYEMHVKQISDDWNNTSNIPEFDPLNNSSYIMTGYGAATQGVHNVIATEIPIRPLQSLGQLQSFDATKNKPKPPFQYNIIGNSHAQPLIADDSVSLTTSGTQTELTNDDSYLLNHVLFDDWFISSIAPDLNHFSSSVERSIDTVYQDHLLNNERLPNRFYLPSNNAYKKSTADETLLVTSTTASPTEGYSYQNIASKLEVKGMFNINSTSVEAWKALLKHSSDACVPYIETKETLLDNATGYPFPRLSVSGNLQYDGSNISGTADGYGSLTENQIDELANQIVNEIKARGPFLSLSEFVNRRLETYNSSAPYALAGVIQASLNHLESLGNSNLNPYKEIKNHVNYEITDPSLIPGNTYYKFPEAALGSPLYGIPSWVTQADILTPIAPMLSARDDTFIIRAYGDARDSSGNVLAEAWCEATVQRTADFVDDVDSPETLLDQLSSNSNKIFGRRFKVISFKWLMKDEL